MIKTRFKNRWSHHISRFLACTVALSSLILAGCATIVSSEVTSFQRWPANAAGATFSFKRLANQANSLEHSSYEDLARAELAKLGLKEATMPPGTPTPANAIAVARGRFEVTLDYGVVTKTINSKEAVWDNAPSYWHHSYFHPQWGWQPGFWSRDQFNSRVVGYRTVSRNVSTRRLRIDISEGTVKLFEASATSSGSNNALPVTMPYLVRSIFDGFPGANGQVRTIEFDTEKNEIKSRQAKQPG